MISGKWLIFSSFGFAQDSILQIWEQAIGFGSWPLAALRDDQRLKAKSCQALQTTHSQLQTKKLWTVDYRLLT